MNLFYAVLLAVIGLLAVIVELFVPAAGLIGLIGLACMIGGVSMSFFHYGTLTGMIFLISLLIITPTIIILWFRRFPRSLVGKKLILFNPGERPGEAQPESPPPSPLIGKTGMVLTDLRPSGTVEVEGKKYSVVTAGEFLAAGKTVKVVKVYGNRIEVREV
jgi:membrane-bound serine protease (ClpP class)